MGKVSKSVENDDVLDGLLVVSPESAKTTTRATPKKPVNYSPELVDKIFEKVASGVSLVKVCQEPGMPGRDAVYSWVLQYEDVRAKYNVALALRAEVLAEAALDTSDMPYLGGDPSVWNAQQRLRVDTRKWAAGTLAPKKYGLKNIISGDEENPVRVLTSNMSPDEAYKSIIDRQAKVPTT